MLQHQVDRRFPVQQVEKSTWIRATRANAAADYLYGNRAVVEKFLSGRPEREFVQLKEQLLGCSQRQLEEYVAATKGESLVFLVLMLTGACNADCTICFTDRKSKTGELPPAERSRLLRQARDLGARYVYVPGEGEPTIDRGFWQMLDTCRETGLEAVVFTNGIVLSDEAACRKHWGLHPDEAVRRLRDYPVSFYFKLWSTDPELVGEMMRIPSRQYHFTDYKGVNVPEGLVRLLSEFPRRRVGIEVVVERRNADEVCDTIVPFAEQQEMSLILEMIQHNGRVLGDGSFDPSSAQALRVAPLLSPTSCSMATCKAVVTSRGYLSPRIAVLEQQIPGPPVDVREGDFFELLHRTDYVTQRRYEIMNCLCEQLPNSLACNKPSTVRAELVNITPPSLSCRDAETAGRCAEGSGQC